MKRPQMQNEDANPHLRVYLDRSVLVDEQGNEIVFLEGRLTKGAEERLNLVKRELGGGFLKNIIAECQRPDVETEILDPQHIDLLEKLIRSVTSEVGRALVGLTVLQLCIKSIAPDQSIRLHKGNPKGNTFSWTEGFPMRVLDKHFVTPTLRQYGLLRLNADGIMMTRSLAENYPYTKLYKAMMRGAMSEWVQLVDQIEMGNVSPKAALKHIIILMINKSEAFESLAKVTLKKVSQIIALRPSAKEIIKFVKSFVDESSYSARVFEIALHSLFQVLEDNETLDGDLKPLCQMRSANKKHGNIGDIEVVSELGGLQIIEAWDAKYGKPYLRDELEELNEKLRNHSETKIAGFVVDRDLDLKKEIVERKQELADLHEGVEIHLLHYQEWVQMQFARCAINPDHLSWEWFRAFAESICQKRRHRAPIDEPSEFWVHDFERSLETILREHS